MYFTRTLTFFTSKESNPRHYVEALINLRLSVAIIMLLS